ncbi:MAG: Trm112 family protein [Pseudomonadota bacterium]
MADRSEDKSDDGQLRVPPADVATPASEDQVDPRILEILVCPLTKTRLSYDKSKNELISKAAGLAFPIREGVPMMCMEAARQLGDDDA